MLSFPQSTILIYLPAYQADWKADWHPWLKAISLIVLSSDLPLLMHNISPFSKITFDFHALSAHAFRTDAQLGACGVLYPKFECTHQSLNLLRRRSAYWNVGMMAQGTCCRNNLCLCGWSHIITTAHTAWRADCLETPTFPLTGITLHLILNEWNLNDFHWEMPLMIIH